MYLVIILPLLIIWLPPLILLLPPTPASSVLWLMIILLLFVMLLVVVTIALVERIHVKIFCNEGDRMVCSRNIVFKRFPKPPHPLPSGINASLQLVVMLSLILPLT